MQKKSGKTKYTFREKFIILLFSDGLNEVLDVDSNFFLSKMDAMQLLPRKFRRGKGAYSEQQCCEQGCSLQELQGYCAL